jgi:hypothetical protein
VQEQSAIHLTTKRVICADAEAESPLVEGTGASEDSTISREAGEVVGIDTTSGATHSSSWISISFASVAVGVGLLVIAL